METLLIRAGEVIANADVADDSRTPINQILANYDLKRTDTYAMLGNAVVDIVAGYGGTPGGTMDQVIGTGLSLLAETGLPDEAVARLALSVANGRTLHERDMERHIIRHSGKIALQFYYWHLTRKEFS